MGSEVFWLASLRRSSQGVVLIFRQLCSNGRFNKLIQQLAKTDLLVLDDWGLEKMTMGQRNDLLEIMEDLHGQRSTLVTSQLPISQWHKAIGDATLADAFPDRLLHNSHKLNLKGESMRKAMSNMEQSDHSE